MFQRIRAVAGRWLTPRFPLEMAFASLATLGLVIAIGDVGRTVKDAKPTVALKSAARPERIQLPRVPADDARTADFIERFALAHVNPPLPESALADPVPAKLSEPAARPPAAPARERIRSANPVKPAPRPAEMAQAEAPVSAPAPRKQDGFRIPIVSDLVSNVGARLPSGRDVLDGAGALARRVGGIFGG